jgi:putative nucleotidyltransferase with HDIG domain
MPTRDDAYQLMVQHVKNENLRKHMLAVEAAMRFYARKYGEDEEIWAMAGLLHDCDYEEYPDLREHTQMSARWLREAGYDERIIYAILAHNDLNLETHPRDNLLSKALYACDEITGMITATALVRPNKSIRGLEVSSVRKKMKSKGFAAGVNREDLVKGAELLGVDLDEHIAFVIEAMTSIAETLGLAGEADLVAD